MGKSETCHRCYIYNYTIHNGVIHANYILAYSSYVWQRSAEDRPVKKAVSLFTLLLWSQGPQNATIQMQVHHLYKKKSNTSFQSSKSPFPSVKIDNLSPLSLLSSQTKKTSSTVTQNAPQPKMKLIRKTSTQ